MLDRLCCDMHNKHCEPPGDLCCWDCTEAAHPDHPPGIVCVMEFEHVVHGLAPPGRM